jgi:Zinc finger, C3HC4 type (RING finger)
MSKKSQFLSCNKNNTPEPVKLKVCAGELQEVYINPTLNISNFTRAELSFEDKKTFPVCIVLKGESDMLINYLKFEGNTLIKIRECYGINRRIYEILDIYCDDKDECSICLTEIKSIMIVPCRHFCLCRRCMNYLMSRDKKCPVCRSYIKIGYKLEY